LARISGKGIIPIGWGTSTKAISARPILSMVLRARERNALVATVTVGMPAFSTSDWSTTSHEVQDPQSAWEAMTISALRPLMTWAIRADSAFDPLIFTVDLSISYSLITLALGNFSARSSAIRSR